ncbi:unnamed protein product [Ophioblennius macclurei]
MAVVNQPGRYAPTDFQTGLCDCFNDPGTCVYGMFCAFCLSCSIASDMGECCLCGLSWPIRSVYRTRYNINGSMLNDYCVAGCCTPCANCQLKRDIELRKRQQIF